VRVIASHRRGEGAVTHANTINATMTEHDVTSSNQLRADQTCDRTDRCLGTPEHVPDEAERLPPKSGAPTRLLVLMLTLPVTIAVLAVALGIFGAVLRLF
jgi:hypothetical protein